jgi:hypothetical protein
MRIMWIATKSGFLSIVQHERDPHTVLVRGRAREDVLAAARIYVGRLTTIRRHKAEDLVKETPDADYRYRFYADADAFEAVILELFRSVDYPNFKNAVKDKDPERAALYGKVWLDLLPIDERYSRNNHDDFFIYRDPDTIDLFEEEDE